MPSIGYQLKKANTNTSATLVANNANILFDDGVINPNSDTNITYTAGTGAFTFAHSANYFVSWFVNPQTSTGSEQAFELQVYTVASGDAVYSYPAESVFKTGQIQGTALITVASTQGVRLRNTSGGTVTLAIGNGVVTAGISLMCIPSYSAIQGYVTGATTTILGPSTTIPFDYPASNQSNSGVNLNTTTNKGAITFTSAGTYEIDWWLSLGSAVGANEVTISVIDNLDHVLQSAYAPVVTDAVISGFAILSVSAASVTAGYSVGLINKTLNADGVATTISLTALTRNAAIKIASTVV